VLGLVGVAGLGTGIGLAAEAGSRICSTNVEIDQPCVDAAAQQDLGWLIAAQAAPFIAFPITHLIRGGSEHSVTHTYSLQLNVSGTQTSVTLSGAF
jgi:hypothetical protein